MDCTTVAGARCAPSCGGCTAAPSRSRGRRRPPRPERALRERDAPSLAHRQTHGPRDTEIARDLRAGPDEAPLDAGAQEPDPGALEDDRVLDLGAVDVDV